MTISKIKHRSLADKYPKSEVIWDILRGKTKYRKPQFCEHNMVAYKDLHNIVDRQLTIINRMAMAINNMEKKFTQTKQSVDWITKKTAEHVDAADKAVIARDQIIEELSTKLKQIGGMN